MYEYYVFAVLILALAAGCVGIAVYSKLNVAMKAVVVYMLFNALATAAALLSGLWFGNNLVVNKGVLLVNTALVVVIFLKSLNNRPHRLLCVMISAIFASYVFILTVPELLSATYFPANAVLVYNIAVTAFCLLYYHIVLLAPSAQKLRHNTRFIVLSGFFLYHAGSMMYWLVTAFAHNSGSAAHTIAYFNAFLVISFYSLVLYAFASRILVSTTYGFDR